jgi:hypothetical protein
LRLERIIGPTSPVWGGDLQRKLLRDAGLPENTVDEFGWTVREKKKESFEFAMVNYADQVLDVMGEHTIL